MDNRLDHDPLLSYWLQKFESYHEKSMDFGLSRTLRLMEDLGNPHLHLPPVIHVAGTNGKGSTIAFLKSMLNRANRTCHVMTSPHLIEFRERFVVTDHMVSSDVLIDFMKRIDEKNNGQSATFFELITAVGFELFAHHPADIVLLETGMGGRLDTTNIVPDPFVTIITMISMDHTQHLGDTVQKIAREKAGIMKQNRPCVIGPQTEMAIKSGVHDVFRDYASALNVPLYRHGYEWDYTITSNGFQVRIADQVFDLPTPSLLGDHQYANAATAFVALYVTQPELLPYAIDGIAHTKWPARLQKLSGQLASLIHDDDEIWLDGGHNDTAGLVLQSQIKKWAAQDQKPIHIILGMLTTKNPLDFVGPLKDQVSSITCITIPDQILSYKHDDLAHIVGGQGASSLNDAIAHIQKNDPIPKRILITGSLYLAGYTLMCDAAN